MSNSSDFNADFASGQRGEAMSAPSGSAPVTPEKPVGKSKAQEGDQLRDCAIVLGIGRYADGTELPGAVKGAEDFANWAIAPEWGGVDAGDISVFVTGSTHWASRGQANSIEDAVNDFNVRLESSREIIGRRLYIYGCGLGLIDSGTATPYLLVDANPKGSIHPALNLRQVVTHFKMIRAFEEIVLVLDLATAPFEVSRVLADPIRLPVRSGPTSLGDLTPTAEFVALDWVFEPVEKAMPTNHHGRFTEVFLHTLIPNVGEDQSNLTLSKATEYLQSMQFIQHVKSPAPQLAVDFKTDFLLQGPEQHRDRPPSRPKGGPDPLNNKFNTAVPDQLDIASTVDQLNRKPFARILARRIWEVNEQRKLESTPKHEREGAYMIHLHGRWGDGKSTVLNFLREELRPDNDPTGWVVVDFNAWRTQSSRPPWWTLVREIHRQACAQTPFKFRRDIWWHWSLWRWLMLVGPWILAGVLILLAGYIMKELGAATELIAGVVAGAIALAALGRSLLFGSSKAAESFMAQHHDASRPVKERYTKLIKAVGQPVIVFVDDMDRCDKTYVVELLEGIQTLFRDAPVTFLIAADRKWICRSFEKHFEDFNQSVGDPARPLGYLFLEKLFQLSVSLPPLSVGMQRDFARALLMRSGGAKNAEVKMERAEQEAERKLESLPESTDTDRLIDETTDALEKQAIQRVVAKRLASVKNDVARQHELDQYADLMERNPRAMKRLLNAYGMQQSLNKLKDPRVPTDHLVRWTIIELRWPLFAEHACLVPDIMDFIGTKALATAGIEPPAPASYPRPSLGSVNAESCVCRRWYNARADRTGVVGPVGHRTTTKTQ